MDAIYSKWLPRLRVALFCVAATGFVYASAEKPIIGVSLDTFKEERWQHDRDAIVARIQKLGGVAIVRSAEWDDAQQVRDIEVMIKAGVDAIIVVPHNASALSDVISRARAAKIDVISYDRLALNSDISYYVGSNNPRVGELQAEYVANHLPDHPAKVVRVFGSSTDHNAAMLKDGQDKVLAPLISSGKVQIVAEDWAQDWKPAEAKRITEAALAKNPSVDAVICSNDGTAGGAIEALTDHNLAGKVLVTGQDADIPALARIKDGTQSMTVYKPLDQLAQSAADLAISIAHGKPNATDKTVSNGKKDIPSILIEPVTVDKSNVNEIAARQIRRNRS
jgi:D-xylose transport system substrate-binding protein